MWKTLVLVSALISGGVMADPLENAPVFELLLDKSEGSPATDADFLSAAWPSIEKKLRAMPLGSTVIVSSVGDSANLPMIWRTRLQAKATKDGAPMEMMVRGMKEVVLTFPARIKGKEDQKSHLIAGLFEASRNMNPQANPRNVIVFVSDMVEFSPLANCVPPRPCKLPKANFRLDNTDLQIIGSAKHLQPAQAMAIIKAWEVFLRGAGVDLKLYQTMGT